MSNYHIIERNNQHIPENSDIRSDIRSDKHSFRHSLTHSRTNVTIQDTEIVRKSQVTGPPDYNS